MKYCLAHVMYSARLSGVMWSGTKGSESAALGSVTRSMPTAISGSDKIAGKIDAVSQSYSDVTRVARLHPLPSICCNAKIEVIENKAV